LGYLIMYGSQVFNLNLVMTGVIVLALCAAGMYLLISRFEKIVLRRFGE
jgi:NitT/TauT family transport system permease protein